jgi:UDP-GlcNAc:undecaprenyl-phosphate/decaprenyl-phosphate GlcNAc-1-phosphate transferase
VPVLTNPLSALVLTLLLMMCAVQLFPRWGLLDFPERYGLQRRRLPYPAGIVAPIVFITIFPFLQAINQQFFGLIGAVAVLAIVSFIDDRRPLPPLFRLFIQAVAACMIVLSGDCVGGRICSVTNPLEGILGGAIIDLNGMLPALAILVTVIWILLTTNALNWFDGIPGQTTALSTIGFLTIGFLSLSSRVDQPQLALIAFTIAAIAFGCFLFDMPPPRIVLGDSGSMFFGLMLGTLTIYAGGKVATAFLVLGVPILDLMFVVLKRISEGRSFYKGSMSGEHLHHRLLAKGWSPRQIILLTASLGTVFGSVALFLDTTEKLIAGGLLVIVMAGLWRYSRPSNKFIAV